MATSTNHRTPDQVRHEIETERAELAGAVDHLRDEIREATDIGAKVRAKLPVITAGALAAGFVIAGVACLVAAVGVMCIRRRPARRATEALAVV